MSSDSSHINDLWPEQHANLMPLIEKCQVNDYLKIGGKAWQQDSSLANYPYSFTCISDCEDLRQFFMENNWPIRTGVIFDDLVFIQQDHCCDWWWALKKAGDDYLAFEDIDFDSFTESPIDFNRFIYSMVTATPDDCISINYQLPDSDKYDFIWSHSYRQSTNDFGQIVNCKEYRGVVEDKYEALVFERPSFPGYTMMIHTKNPNATLVFDDNFDTAQRAICAVENKIEFFLDRDIQAKTLEQRSPLLDLVSDLHESSKALATNHPSKPNQAKEL